MRPLSCDVTVAYLPWITLFTAKTSFHLTVESKMGFTVKLNADSIIEYCLSIELLGLGLGWVGLGSHG